MEGASELHADHNLFYLPQTDVVLHHGEAIFTDINLDTLGDANLYGDPRFVSPAWGDDGDYHLVAGSPAIDAGTTGLASDLEGALRDEAPDLGAYEYVREEVREYLPLIVQPAS